MRDVIGRLVELLTRRRERYEGQLGRPIVHPITGKPGFFIINPYPPAATDEDLDQFVIRTGVELPADIRTWLKVTNGAGGFFGVKPVDERCDIENIWRQRPEWQRNQWIPVGKDAFGNWYVRIPAATTPNRGAICFVEYMDPNVLVYVAASSPLNFAEFELENREALDAGEEYGWPFDRAFVLSRDPELAHADIAPLPWES